MIALTIKIVHYFLFLNSRRREVVLMSTTSAQDRGTSAVAARECCEGSGRHEKTKRGAIGEEEFLANQAVAPRKAEVVGRIARPATS